VFIPEPLIVRHPVPYGAQLRRDKAIAAFDRARCSVTRPSSSRNLALVDWRCAIFKLIDNISSHVRIHQPIVGNRQYGAGAAASPSKKGISVLHSSRNPEAPVGNARRKKFNSRPVAPTRYNHQFIATISGVLSGHNDLVV